MSNTTNNQTSRADKSPKDTFDELRGMATAYAKQETVEPLKALGQWVGFGLGGAIFVFIGLLFLGLGGLRALQTQVSWFEGNWNFAPYLIMFVVFGIVIGLTVKAMLNKPDYGD